MMHRMREAMRDGTFPGPIGGHDKVVEADETYVGGKAKNRAYKPEPQKHIIMSLVERGGEVRSFHVSTAETKCAKWRRDIVPVGLREKGLGGPGYDCGFGATLMTVKGAPSVCGL